MEKNYSDLIIEIANQLSNLDGGADFISLNSEVFNRGVNTGKVTEEDLKQLADGLSEYGFDDQAELVLGIVNS